MEESLSFHYKKLILKKNICIVGSSEIILKKKDGKSIDNFDEVVRFNRSKVSKYEKHVGTKTTLRILNNHVFTNTKIWNQDLDEQFFAKKLRNQNILIIAPKKIEQKFLKKNMHSTNRYYFLNSKKVLYLSLLKFICDIKISSMIYKILFSGLNYSVGLCFIMYLILKKIPPVLFGFDLSEDMKNRSHYYQTPVKPGGRHNLEIEHKIIKELLNKGLLNVR